MGRKLNKKRRLRSNNKRDNLEVMAAIDEMRLYEGLQDCDIYKMLEIRENTYRHYKTGVNALPTSALFFLARKLGYNIYLVKYPRLKR